MISLFSTPSSALDNCLQNLEKVFFQGEEFRLREQFLLATQPYMTVSLLSCSSELRDQARVRWAQSLFELGESEEGNRILHGIESPLLKKKSRTIQAFYQPNLISSLPHEEQLRWKTWEEEKSKLPLKKSPAVAGILSAVLPGSGQVYNGLYQSAAFQFVLNALFLSAALELQRKELPSSAAVAGVMFTMVYGGSIFGSVSAAKNLNLRFQQQDLQYLKIKHFPELGSESPSHP